MPHSASPLAQTPQLASFLERELAGRPSHLPAEVALPPRLLQRALLGPLLAFAQRPSKQFRARLAQLSWQLAGGKGELPEELAAVIEAYHLGSLIVDDIQDGSLERRGGRSLHREMGVPLALNAGNWLYFWPGQLLARARFEPAVELSLRRAIDRAILRCHYGQALDLAVRVSDLRQREVREVVHAVTRLKTGSLFELAAELGAIAANTGDDLSPLLGAFGRNVGVALQMLDDLTSVTRECRRKKGREDLLCARPSWVWAWLSESSDDLGYQRFRAQAMALSGGALDPDPLLEQLAERVAERGKLAIRARLGGSLVALREALGESDALDELERELERLERYDV